MKKKAFDPLGGVIGRYQTQIPPCDLGRIPAAAFIDMYADLSDDEIVRYQADYLSSSPEKEGFMGLRKTFMEEGRKEGHQEGVRQGIQEGIREGLMKAIELGVTLKFGKENLILMNAIHQIKDVGRLERISEMILTIDDVSEFKKGIETASSKPSQDQ